MYGSGEEFSSKAPVFANQLVSLYTKTIGDWSEGIIIFISFVTMFSTVITVVDAYPRTLEESVKMFKKDYTLDRDHKLYWFWLILIMIGSIIIVKFFSSNLKVFVDFVTMIAFLAAPIFAILNYLVIKKDFIPAEFRIKPWLNTLSLIGIAFFCFIRCLLLIEYLISEFAHN